MRRRGCHVLTTRPLYALGHVVSSPTIWQQCRYPGANSATFCTMFVKNHNAYREGICDFFLILGMYVINRPGSSLTSRVARVTVPLISLQL